MECTSPVNYYLPVSGPDIDPNLEKPFFDKNGRQIKEFAVVKVFHFIGRRKKKHYMYHWVRLNEVNGIKYYFGEHLNDNTGFFEKGSKQKYSGYRLLAVADEIRRLNNYEIVQQYDH